MTEFVFARHGQASFGAADYDKLSDIGHVQSRLLGEWLASHAEHPFDAVVVGPMLRHRETLDGIVAAYADRAHELPAALCMDALAEFDHRGVLEAFVRRHPQRESVAAAQAGRSRDQRAVYRFLRDGLQTWASGELDAQVPEPWAHFQDRIRGAARALIEHCAERRRVLVVTSGGVMSQLAQQALGAPSATGVELNLSIRNTALAEFRCIDGAMTLATWNSLPHLAAPDRRTLWTHY
jgi:broad specificity phosphatase PhoE